MSFKVLEWMRKVRDEDYGKTKEISLKGKIEYTRKTAEKFLQSMRARDTYYEIPRKRLKNGSFNEIR